MHTNIQSIAVCGAGTMGAGIAQIAAQSGFTTILFDVNEATLLKAQHTIVDAINILERKGKLSTAQANTTLNNLTFTGNIQWVKANCIIEAIVEKIEAKISLLQTLMELNGQNCVYATNTSSISIAAIAEQLMYKENVVGIHFFNPATVMRLVEIIKSDFTANYIIDAANNIATAMGKTTVLCNDFPGFIVNRVARHFYLEGMHLVEQGLASIEEVDEAMQNAGFKLGPFALMDLIGLDINYNVSCIVYNDLRKPTRLQPSALQKEKVEAGKLGKKTGEGFYKY